MGRTTKQNKITSPELLAQVNPENTRLLEDFLTYLRSVQRSETTVLSYKSDISIFNVWNLLNNKNKFFVDVTKRDIIAYQGYLLNTNQNSPARIRRMKSALSSMSNYIENILDDEYKGYRPIVRKVESPLNQPVREKTVLSEEQIQLLLKTLVDNNQCEKACLVALAAYSGRRKHELLLFKTSYFDDSNIMFGSLYKTPEKIKTKGRGLGKFIYAYTLAHSFKPYFDLWMKQRAELGIESIWLFPDKNDMSIPMNIETVNSWTETFSKILGVNFYMHACRHRFTSNLSEQNIKTSVIQLIMGWSDPKMVSVYVDSNDDDEIGKYFDENGIKQVKSTELSDL